MERFWLFWPEILPIAVIALAFYIYIRLFGNFYKDYLNSISWVKKNGFVVDFFYFKPQILILAPTLEELMFRLPLLIMFPALSQEAWIGIWISSIIFGLIHWPGQKINPLDIFMALKNGEVVTDCVKTETDRIVKNKSGEMIYRRLIHTLMATGAGVTIGYFGLKYQSLWLCVGIHAAYNLLMPIVVVLVMGMLSIVYLVIIFILVMLGVLPPPPPPPGRGPYDNYRY